MGRQGVFENYSRAEGIERMIEKEGIPIVPAITVHDNKMQDLEGHYSYKEKNSTVNEYFV